MQLQHKQNEPIFYYRVRMADAAKVPMTLVDAIRRQTGPTDGQAPWDGRARYHLGWEILGVPHGHHYDLRKRCNHLLSDSFEVLGVQGSYNDDNDLANRFCRCHYARESTLTEHLDG